VAALLSVVMPGFGHYATGARFRPAVIVATVLNVVAMIAIVVILADVGRGADFADVIADRPTFVSFAALLLVLAGTRLWAAIDSAWLARPTTASRWTVIASGVAVLVVTLVGVAPIVVAADYARRTDSAIEQVFGNGKPVTANPGTLAPTTTQDTPDTPDTSSTSGTPDSTSSTSSTAPPTTLAPFAGLDRVNVLLLGGDAGPGRYSLRTDSMIVVSMDPATGDTAMISIPRNLQKLPFPPDTPLAEKFPKGFIDLANSVYTYANNHRELAGGGDDAGAQAVKQGIAQLLGIPINYYVLVDMAGFVDVVDSLGGIDIDVPKRVPSPGNPRNAKHPVPKYIEAGEQHMDGTLALAYARTRSADSDYQRMGRQRCVLAAISKAATPKALATGLPGLLDAFGAAVRTDIPRSELGDFAQVVQRYADTSGTDAVRTLHLAPPLVRPARWDAAEVRALVSAVLEPVPPPEFTGELPVLTETCGA
jgi:LCP family protein required for cell wall assembly